MKNKIAHEIPLVPTAVDVLRSLPRFAGPYVFSTKGGHRPISGFGQFKDSITTRLAEISPAGISDWRFHDLRRTVRTNLAKLGVSPFIAEQAIGHRQKGVHAVYDCHTYRGEKRAALDLWAARLRDIVDPPPQNVVPLRLAGQGGP